VILGSNGPGDITPPSLSPQCHHPPRPHDVVDPMPSMSPQHRRTLLAHDEFNPATLSTLRHPQACRYASFPSQTCNAIDFDVDVCIFAMLMYTCAGAYSTWCYGQFAPWLLYIFLCHFGPTSPEFDMLYCHIALICYIALIC
jgi:hypothetical protein